MERILCWHSPQISAGSSCGWRGCGLPSALCSIPQSYEDRINRSTGWQTGCEPFLGLCRRAGVEQGRTGNVNQALITYGLRSNLTPNQRAHRVCRIARHRTLRSRHQTLSAGRLRQARLNRIHAEGNWERTRPRVPFSAPARKTGGLPGVTVW